MNDFLYGIRKGLPIGIGYLAVSFAFGVYAVTGLSPLCAILISLTNLTSAGQFAGVKMILANASYFEIGLAVLLINLRYALMSLSLSQKIDSDIPTWQRLIWGFGITDEIYAVAITEHKKITTRYMLGLILTPIIGWTLGTALGAFGAGIFPQRLLDALGIALYAMFIAIVVPDAKKSLAITLVSLLSIGLACIFEYVPYVKEIGVGFKIIICTVVASLFGALVFPLKDKETPKEDTPSEDKKDGEEPCM